MFSYVVNRIILYVKENVGSIYFWREWRGNRGHAVRIALSTKDENGFNGPSFLSQNMKFFGFIDVFVKKETIFDDVLTIFYFFDVSTGGKLMCEQRLIEGK